MKQLSLPVEEIQDGEAYLVYRDVHVWYLGDVPNPHYDSEDCYGFNSPSPTMKGTIHTGEKVLEGIVVDSHTLNVMMGRMEPYAREYEEDLIKQNEEKTKLPEYRVRVVYSLKKERLVTFSADVKK